MWQEMNSPMRICHPSAAKSPRPRHYRFSSFASLTARRARKRRQSNVFARGAKQRGALTPCAFNLTTAHHGVRQETAAALRDLGDLGHRQIAAAGIVADDRDLLPRRHGEIFHRDVRDEGVGGRRGRRAVADLDAHAAGAGDEAGSRDRDPDLIGLRAECGRCRRGAAGGVEGDVLRRAEAGWCCMLKPF